MNIPLKQHLIDPFDSFWNRKEAIVNNVKYSYFDQNPTGKSAILFLHGFPDLAWGWRYQLDEFSKSYRCIAPDMIGYGQTDSPLELERYTFKRVCQDLICLMDILSIDNFMVVCHDWGGMAGWRLCQYYPHRVLGLVSLCTAFQKPNPVFVPLEEIVKTLPNLNYQLVLARSEASQFLDENVDQLFDHIFYHISIVLDNDVNPLLSAMKGPSTLIKIDTAYHKRVYKQKGFRGPLNWYRTRFLNSRDEAEALNSKSISNVRCPCSLILASRDIFLTRQMAKKMAITVPQCRIEEIDATHWLMVEVPDKDSDKVKECREKIKKEQMVLDGAVKMLQIANPTQKNMVEMSIIESKRRLEFLEGELKRLEIKKVSIADPEQTANMTTLDSTETRIDLLRYEANITPVKVAYRLKETSLKLDFEARVKSGSENMINAFVQSRDVDIKRQQELESQLAASKAKEQILIKAKNRYKQLHVGVDDDSQDALLQNDTTGRITGRLKLKMIEAVNITGRKSLKDDIICVISVDGIAKVTTKPTKSKWDELVDLQIDRGQELEFKVCDKNNTLLALIWFRLADLVDDLDEKLGKDRGQGLDNVPDTWLDLEPSGQLAFKVNFIPVSRAATTRNKIFRRDAVQKVYPRNGHRYFARQFYQVMQCTVCSEFLGRQGYQCSACNNTIHPRCYQRVVTKCIPLDQMADAPDKNTGQLLKYKIPHRWDAVINLGASWCSHCGYILPPGKKIARCSECSKKSHLECQAMVPCFCGLDPAMADTLIAAFEAHEQKMHQKELEEASANRNVVPVFEAADITQLNAALETTTNPVAGQDSVGTSEDLIKSEPLISRPATAQKVPDVKPSETDAASSSAQITDVSDLRFPKDRASTAQNSITEGAAPILPPRISEAAKEPRVSEARVSATANKVIPNVSKDVTLDDFHFVAVLGRGAFGKVMLATEKTTNNLYAIKALKKEFIVQNDDVKSVKLEKFIFQAASQHHHPFMVNLHSAFDTPSRIYFVMEYVSGGDLMCHIQEKKRFHQGRARFYACEVLTAIQYFHANGIIYRDLKLDNILLAADGHIKVADYGICKANMPFGTTTATFCGTPDYMAPEILMNRRYGVGVDWWSFGVLIYVMLVGSYPFHGEDENDILEAILADAIEYPSNLPRVTLNLLQSLMHKNPARRLGAGRDDAEEVKRHPYFTGVDWEALLRRETTPPFVPTIANARDVSNFDKEFTSEAPVLTPITSVLSEADQKEFNDFFYISDWAYNSRVQSAIASNSK